MFAGAAAIALALTGCSGGQSTTEACSDLQSSVESVASDLSASMGSLASDPDQAIEELEGVSDAFSDGADDVSNAEVKEAADKADESLKNLVSELKDYVESDGEADTEDLTEASSAVQDDFSAIGEVCNG
jgi:uncharacterized phage infection (PIP) family protein YhgE